LSMTLFLSPSWAQEKTMTGIYDALTQNDDWLNTSRALTPDDLKGRVVLVDFWTYCCINCIHVIPKLQKLEREFGHDLTVIGVHSAKFANEGDPDNIREAIQKFGIEHAVVNDADFRIWNTFGINAWPTLLLIGPDGLMEEVYRGEGDVDAMRRDIQQLLRKNKDVVKTPLPLALEKSKVPPTILRFPTKLDSDGQDTLVISDSGHQRILTVDIKTERITHTIGSGKQGFKDGSFTEAMFNNPQGVLIDGNQIFVADTGNHRLRVIDLEKERVSTLAGTGERGGYTLFGKGNAMKTALASPWDLAFYPDMDHIVIANAGTHQLWEYDRKRRTLDIIAGSGRESIDDGKQPYNSLSQPSGLSAQDDKLYFVDAETSSLRVFDGKEIKTLIGSGLFDFGLKDGVEGTALMQHPVGLYADEDMVYIADTFNNKLRAYRGDTLSTVSLNGLKEPSDVLRLKDMLYIADTNNHRIVTTPVGKTHLVVLNVMPMEKAIAYQERLPNMSDLGALTIKLASKVELQLPGGWHINDEAPSYLAVFDDAHQSLGEFKVADLKDARVKLPVLEAGKTYTLQGVLYYCKKAKGSQCLIRGITATLTPAVDAKHGTIMIDLPKPEYL
jgi:thiol-disulfide isomerase/thioredoxin